MPIDRATPDSLWLPVGAGPARWIVCERRGRWAVALRREPEAAGVRLHEVRSLADCWVMVEGHPASFVVLEATPANLDAVLARLDRIARSFPLARAAVVAQRPLAAYDGLAREMGAVWFAASVRSVAPIASIARRHIESAPSPDRSCAERIWDSLPWGRRGEEK